MHPCPPPTHTSLQAKQLQLQPHTTHMLGHLHGSAAAGRVRVAPAMTFLGERTASWPQRHALEPLWTTWCGGLWMEPTGKNRECD